MGGQIMNSGSKVNPSHMPVKWRILLSSFFSVWLIPGSELGAGRPLAESEAVCRVARPPLNLLTGQSFMMCDIDWVSPQVGYQSNPTSGGWLHIAQ